MNCKTCKNTIKSSQRIIGLEYCGACDKYFFTGSVVDVGLTPEDILREIIIINGSSSSLQDPRCIHLIMDLIDLDMLISKAYLEIMHANPHLYIYLNDAKSGNVSDALNDIILTVSKNNNTSDRLIKYIVEICAYALGLCSYVEPYEGKVDSTFKIEKFEANKNYIKSGESVEISWRITGKAIVEVIFNDGNSYTSVKESGSKIVNPITDSDYKIKVSSESYNEEQKLSIKILRRPFYTTWWFWAATSIVIAFFAFEIIRYKYATVQEATILTESIHNVDKLIPGYYSVRQSIDGNISSGMSNAEIRLDSINKVYIMLIVSQFDPEIHQFEVKTNNKLYSKTMGEGVILYKEKIDRMTIVFNNGNIQWELKK